MKKIKVGDLASLVLVIGVIWACIAQNYHLGMSVGRNAPMPNSPFMVRYRKYCSINDAGNVALYHHDSARAEALFRQAMPLTDQPSSEYEGIAEARDQGGDARGAYHYFSLFFLEPHRLDCEVHLDKLTRYIELARQYGSESEARPAELRYINIVVWTGLFFELPKNAIKDNDVAATYAIALAHSRSGNSLEDEVVSHPDIAIGYLLLGYHDLYIRDRNRVQRDIAEAKRLDTNDVLCSVIDRLQKDMDGQLPQSDWTPDWIRPYKPYASPSSSSANLRHSTNLPIVRR